MKITDLKAHILPPTAPTYRWSEAVPGRAIQFILLRIMTDTELEGQVLAWKLLAGEVRDAMPGLRARLVGRDPHEVEAISQELTFGLERPTNMASHVDVALWDLIGKRHGEPLYRLFGGARNRLPAYADVFFQERIEDYVAKAEQCREAGFLGVKLHPYGVAAKDIAVCRAVRKALGDDFALFIDAHNAYSRADAIKVGRVLEELNFVWFEAPILDSDIQGLTALSETLDVPIAGAESVIQGLRAYPPYLLANAFPILRATGDVIGGISALRKVASLCQAFNLRFEAHSYGTPHMIAAHLHVMFAMNVCDWVELPFPQDSYEVACRDGVRVQRDGHVHAPSKPGLGYEVDLEEIRRRAVEEV